MIRLGSKYQHLVPTAGCPCHTPQMQRLTERLSRVSRRSFLAGIGATLASGHAPSALAQAPARTLFREARLFDGRSAALRSGVQVLVEGGRIAAVDQTNAAPPDGARVIAGGGRVLMPGLIDAHWHAIYAALPPAVLSQGEPGYIFAAAASEAQRTLLRGFTTVRDLGGPTFAFKQAIDEGLIPGPRIYPSGAMITTSGGHGDLRALTEIPRRPGRLSVVEDLGATMIADGTAEVRLRTREQLLQGASQVKFTGGGGVSSPRSPLDMLTFSEEELRAGIDVAKDWNTYATVHAYMPRTIARAIAAGAACIEHGHLMDDGTARLMSERGIWLSMQPFVTEADSVPLTGPSRERMLQILTGTGATYTLAKRYGIKTAFGTDLLFSPALTVRQPIMLTHLTRWYSNAEILTMATSTNAALLRLSGERNPYPAPLGVVETGAHADLLLVEGNPLNDVRLLEDPERSLTVIMKDGRIFKNALPA